MSDKKGLNELLEVLDLAEALTLKLMVAAKDGLSVADLALLIDADLLARARAAASGVSQVGDELKDVDLEEAGLLALRALKFLKTVRAQIAQPVAVAPVLEVTALEPPAAPDVA